MAQQMVNGSYYKGSVTYTYPMSDRYAVVGEPNRGLHHQRKPNRHGKTQPKRPVGYEHLVDKFGRFTQSGFVEYLETKYRFARIARR